MYRYRFSIVWANHNMIKSAELLKKMDIDIGDVGCRETFEFTSLKNHDIAELKIIFTRIFSEMGYKILHIEGGKIE